MIPEVEILGIMLSELYSNHHPPVAVTVMEGMVMPYEGLAVSVTGASTPPGFGKGMFSVDVSIHLRSRRFSEVFRLAGWVANYPTSTGPVAVNYGAPDPQIGGSECKIESSILASEIYPDGFIPFEESTTETIWIRYVAGKEELRGYRQVAP